jgi:hypothetical protein
MKLMPIVYITDMSRLMTPTAFPTQANELRRRTVHLARCVGTRHAVSASCCIWRGFLPPLHVWRGGQGVRFMNHAIGGLPLG